MCVICPAHPNIWIAACSFIPSNPTHHLLPAPYKAFKNAHNYIFTLEMETAMFAETDNFQHLKQLILKN
jgi:hypothetical protein